MEKREREYLELRERDGESGEGGDVGFGGEGHGVGWNDSVLRNRTRGAKEGQRLHAHGKEQTQSASLKAESKKKRGQGLVPRA